MKKIFKIFILVFVICILFTNIILASKVEKPNIQHFIYNDTTYVPLRKLIEILDKDLRWDSEININIRDKDNKINNYYNKHKAFKTALITMVEDDFLELEFQLKNIENEENIIALHHPYYNFIIYDENESEVYNYQKKFPISIPVVKEEKIPRDGYLKVNNKVDLKDLNLNSSETYKVVFSLSFEDEENRYMLSEKSYFKNSMKSEETYIEQSPIILDLVSKEYRAIWESSYKYETPILIDNYTEWINFLKKYPPELKNVNILQQNYNDEFFKERLVYAYIKSEGSGSNSLTVQRAEIKEDKLNLFMDHIVPEEGTSDMATLICLFGIKRNDIENVKTVEGIILNGRSRIDNVR